MVPMSSLPCVCCCRAWQIVEWLAEADGGEVLIVLDECHRAKNLLPPTTTRRGREQEPKATKTALAVLALQNALPNARWVGSLLQSLALLTQIEFCALF